MSILNILAKRVFTLAKEFHPKKHHVYRYVIDIFQVLIQFFLFFFYNYRDMLRPISNELLFILWYFIKHMARFL